jgi:hypothetical protein
MASSLPKVRATSSQRVSTAASTTSNAALGGPGAPASIFTAPCRSGRTEAITSSDQYVSSGTNGHRDAITPSVDTHRGSSPEIHVLSAHRFLTNDIYFSSPNAASGAKTANNARVNMGVGLAKYLDLPRGPGSTAESSEAMDLLKRYSVAGGCTLCPDLARRAFSSPCLKKFHSCDRRIHPWFHQHSAGGRSKQGCVALSRPYANPHGRVYTLIHGRQHC